MEIRFTHVSVLGAISFFNFSYYYLRLMTVSFMCFVVLCILIVTVYESLEYKVVKARAIKSNEQRGRVWVSPFMSKVPKG